MTILPDGITETENALLTNIGNARLSEHISNPSTELKNKSGLKSCVLVNRLMTDDWHQSQQNAQFTSITNNAYLKFHHPEKQNGVPSDPTLYQQTKIEGLDASSFRIRSCGEHCDFEQPESIINLKPLTQKFRFNQLTKAAK